MTLLLAVIGTTIIGLALKAVMGLRASAEVERAGWISPNMARKAITPNPTESSELERWLKNLVWLRSAACPCREDRQQLSASRFTPPHGSTEALAA